MKKPAGEAGLPSTVSQNSLLVGGSDREFRTLVHDMLAFASAIQDVRNRLGQLIGLSGTQYTIVMAIARLSEDGAEIGINQIAEHLHLSGAFVTIEVNKLVLAGLVEKRPNPDDRRRVVLTITQQARRRVLELSRVQVPANDALFAGLSATEFRALQGVMSKLVRNGEPTLHLIDYLAPGGSLERPARARRPVAAK